MTSPLDPRTLQELTKLSDDFKTLDNSLKANQEHIKEFLNKKCEDAKIKESAVSDAEVLEKLGSDALIRNQLKNDSEEVSKWFEQAYISRRASLFNLSKPDIEDLFSFCVNGLVCRHTSQIRVLLEDIEIPKLESDNWGEILEFNLMNALILLTRKKRGWSDIQNVIEVIKKLKEDQKRLESSYLETGKERSVPNLIAYYNLARMIELTAEYILNGNPANINIKLKRHFDNSKTASGYGINSSLQILIDQLYIGCSYLIKGSIWYNSRSLATNVKLKEYIETLTQGKTPIIELLPSQQDALDQDPLSIVKRSIVISMPTSAGKTMMAEFAIIQAISVNESAKIIYVVPTRALVNQVTLDLRRKFRPLRLTVEAAVPAFELDSTEDELLQKDFNVLVSTPEKIDLLFRGEHPAVKDISLVVVDEAHNLQETGGRGAKLELLLTTINRERANVRFLLLSPFIPNSDEIAGWLGEDQSKDIKVEWQASEQVTAVSYVGSRNSKEILFLNIIPSHINQFVKEEFEVKFSDNLAEGRRQSLKKASVSTALNFISDDGCVLVLCRGKKDATERAKSFDKRLSEIKLDETSELIIDFIEEELGEQHILPKLLRKGIGIHHSGLSLETRYLVERLIDLRKIKVLAATTTLAQGVNFPIKHVIIESISIPARPPKLPRDMTYSEFWNVAGRAGRAFYDHMGMIIFSAANPGDIEKHKKFLEQKSDEVLSSILHTLKDVDEINVSFDVYFVKKYPELANFIQYLLHVVKTSSYKDVISNLEETLRGSLVYHQLERKGEDGSKLIQLAKSYLEQLGVIAENKGMQNLIDGTGFTSITVKRLMNQNEQLVSEGFWDSSKLFKEGDISMAKVVDILKDVPEIDLGRFVGGELDVGEVSNIIKSWVNGESIISISEKYFSKEPDETERIFKASNYVNTQLMTFISWGMNALQKISAFYNKDIDLKKIGHIPAYVYFGTKTEESLVMRMMNVPRFVAEGLGDEFKREFKQEKTFSNIRAWLINLEDDKWVEASRLKKIQGTRVKKLWKILNGLE